MKNKKLKIEIIKKYTEGKSREELLKKLEDPYIYYDFFGKYNEFKKYVDTMKEVGIITI